MQVSGCDDDVPKAIEAAWKIESTRPIAAWRLPMTLAAECLYAGGLLNYRNRSDCSTRGRREAAQRRE